MTFRYNHVLFRLLLFGRRCIHNFTRLGRVTVLHRRAISDIRCLLVFLFACFCGTWSLRFRQRIASLYVRFAIAYGAW